MNTPESITVDLEHAKKLKEAGWAQEESFWWWAHIEGNEWEVFPDGYPYVKAFTRHAAPTASEILRRFPQWIEDEENYLRICPVRSETQWYIGYEDGEGRQAQGFSRDSLANAAAAMYCNLSENKLLQ